MYAILKHRAQELGVWYASSKDASKNANINDTLIIGTFVDGVWVESTAC